MFLNALSSAIERTLRPSVGNDTRFDRSQLEMGIVRSFRIPYLSPDCAAARKP